MTDYLYGWDAGNVATDGAGNIQPGITAAVTTDYAGTTPFTATKAVNPATMAPGASTSGIVTAASDGRLGFYATDYNGDLYLQQGGKAWPVKPTLAISSGFNETQLDAYLGGEASNLVVVVAGKAEDADLAALAASLTTALADKADLGSDGKVLPAQLPAPSGGTSGPQPFGADAADQTARLAMSSLVAGTRVLQLDNQTLYELVTLPASSAGNWRAVGMIASNYVNARSNAYFKLIVATGAAATRPIARSDIHYLVQTLDGAQPNPANGWLQGDDWFNGATGT